MQVKKVIAIGSVLLAVHLILRAQRKKEPAIRYVEKVPFGFNALTLPPAGIYIEKVQEGNEALLQHELIHWKQYQRMGLLPYYINYAYGMTVQGYDRHPMEIEARANESEYCRLNYTECVRNGSALTVRDPNFRKVA